jgi:tungstate transport system substrate-binding protein
MVLVHARTLEDKFVAEGYGVDRRDVMYNDFVILGPAADPAGIAGLKDAAEAFGKIAAAKATFVSRGDQSGTHVKERELWTADGVEPAGAWYLEAGLGMGEVITMATERLGYALADRGTYLAYKDKTDLKVLVEGDERLFNPYGVIAVNPEKHPHVKFALAQRFIGYLVSPEGQAVIAAYPHGGDPLFFIYQK